MEERSVNKLLFEYFRSQNSFADLEYNIKNNTQNVIAGMKFKNPSLVVSYEPFASTLQAKGFKIIDSSKNSNLLIVDVLYLKNGKAEENIKRLQKLNIVIHNAMLELKKDPKTFYLVVKPYLDGESYEEFLLSLKNIEFINGNKAKILDMMKQKQLQVETIL